MQRFILNLSLISFFLSSYASQASTAVMDDVHVGFDLGTQSSLIVANAIKACGLTHKESNSLMLRQKKAGLALYGELESDFDANFDQGFKQSFPLIEKALSEGTIKVDRSVCPSLHLQDL